MKICLFVAAIRQLKRTHLGSMAPFAVCKKWFSEELERKIWHYAFVTPTAEAMKGVTIRTRSMDHGWVRTTLRAKDGTSILAACGLNLMNPCVGCEMYDLIGVGSYCGQCRWRPTVCRQVNTALLNTKWGDRSASPRQDYVRMIQRQTCPVCLTLYRHNHMIVDFIAEEGCCPTCDRGRGL